MTNGDDSPFRGAVGSYKLRVDGGWEFLELAEFVRQFVHVYSFIHALGMIADAVRLERLQWAFRAHPWRGGWDSVNFFKSLVGTVPIEHRPKVASIQMASPGSIDLRLAMWAARQTGHVVDAVCIDSVDKANATYREMYERARDMRLLRKDVKNLEVIEPQEFRFAQRAAEDLIEIMGMTMYMHRLSRLAGGNPLSLMKVIFALYRRVRVLAELQDGGKIRF